MFYLTVVILNVMNCRSSVSEKTRETQTSARNQVNRGYLLDQVQICIFNRDFQHYSNYIII